VEAFILFIDVYARMIRNMQSFRNQWPFEVIFPKDRNDGFSKPFFVEIYTCCYSQDLVQSLVSFNYGGCLHSWLLFVSEPIDSAEKRSNKDKYKVLFFISFWFWVVKLYKKKNYKYHILKTSWLLRMFDIKYVVSFIPTDLNLLTIGCPRYSCTNWRAISRLRW
jgi:hypothetical protein